MGFKNRGYSTEVPEDKVRDYKLFVIACEGDEREFEYFKVFERLSKKIKIDVVDEKYDDEGNEITHQSSPKGVLNRAMQYISKEGLDKQDDLWFVIDKDRWKDEQIRELNNYCNDYPNWHLVVSNPSFEVWLYFHYKTSFDDASKSPQDLKNEISQFEKFGYNRWEFIKRFKDAVQNAEKADSDPNHFMPKPKETKVYNLGKALLEKSITEFDSFIENEIPRLIELEKDKVRSKGKKNRRTNKRK